MGPTITRVRTDFSTRVDQVAEGEKDRASITANGIVVDVIANEDGTVYVETYSADARVGVVKVDGYDVEARHPSVTLRLVP